ncbi:hypothetical protein EDC04DRAFT_2914553 [Pisolithus marmoratus]|nr:hypothetical protein EDC04DRAFT_2914553 [Pisolithus marmoratus]
MPSLWSRFTHVKSASDPDAVEEAASQSSAKQAGVVTLDTTETESPGGLSLTEGSAGGLGRHLGVVSCTLLIIGRIIGTGIFSTPSSILSSTGSFGASLLLWLLGFILSFCGLFIWLEFGTMFPKMTIIFAANAILLGFTASGCIVFVSNILVAAGKTATTWSERGIALGVIFFATVLHGFTPQTGVRIMNVRTVDSDSNLYSTTSQPRFLPPFKIAILVFIVVSGWVVLSGKTNIKDPYANFRDTFVLILLASRTYFLFLYPHLKPHECEMPTYKGPTIDYILDAYAGWSNVNYVLNDVRNPVRTP